MKNCFSCVLYFTKYSGSETFIIDVISPCECMSVLYGRWRHESPVITSCHTAWYVLDVPFAPCSLPTQLSNPSWLLTHTHSTHSLSIVDTNSYNGCARLYDYELPIEILHLQELHRFLSFHTVLERFTVILFFSETLQYSYRFAHNVCSLDIESIYSRAHITDTYIMDIGYNGLVYNGYRL